MSQVKTEGYVFKVINYNETSQIVHLFSREFGIIPILIRGALKMGQSNENFDLFSKSSFVLYEPHSGEIYRYKESSLLQSGIGFSKNIKTFYRISLLFKIISKILPQGNPSTEIYELLDRVSNKIRKYTNTDQNKLYIFYFMINLLKIEGYGTNFSVCSICKNPFRRAAYFSISKSELLCNKCNTSKNNIYLNNYALQTLNYLANGNIGKIDYALFNQHKENILKIIALSLLRNFNINIDEFQNIF